MRVLVVAHPDDEALWGFDLESFDKIVICFLGRSDRPDFAAKREAALAEHPLKDKIECWELLEPDDSESAKRIAFVALCDIMRLKSREDDWYEVTTHGADGDYGHPHHKLVFQACMDQLSITVNGRDPALYRSIKAVYVKHGCWTWDT